jgi:hypothetical protein
LLSIVAGSVAAGLVAAMGTLALRQPHAVVDATLGPLVLRGQPELPTIHVASRSSRLRLHLILEEPLPREVMAVAVSWRREDMDEQTAPAKEDADRDGISLVLDGSQIDAGTYELIVRGQRPNRAPEDIAVYAFRLATR